ncbi:MAG: carboxypeptidase-like regulatory domain-containing protein, partial [Acidimicrobiales bacterium]
MPRRLVLVQALAVVAALVAGGCASDQIDSLPPAPPLPPTTTTIDETPDLSGFEMARAPGRTTTTSVALGPGGSSLVGTVTTPEGPVVGATVSVERLVGDVVASADLRTGADGTWGLADIRGGRYRVRAWKPAPDNLALTSPEIFFLGAGEARVVNMAVGRFQGVAVNAAIAPTPPFLNEVTRLAVQITDRGVDERGVVRAFAVPRVAIEVFGT